MADYLYGTYGHLAKSISQSAVQSGTTAVYVGFAPVHLVRGWESKGLVNKPLKLTSYAQAQRLLGYSDDWASFTLSEAVHAHFKNPLGNVGPIYVINATNPTSHSKSANTTKSLAFTGGKASFISDTIILDTFTLTGKTEGTDYSLDYNYETKTVSIDSIGDPLTGTINATYKEIDPVKFGAADIIGGISANGVYSGLAAVQLLYQEEFAITNLIVAPGWSEFPNVYRAMLEAAEKINGHWDAFVLADLPLELRSGGSGENAYSNEGPVSSITQAITWKRGHSYDSKHSKVFWPQAKDADGNIYHLSTLACVEFLRADNVHRGIPMETCGNKAVPVTRQYFGTNAVNQGFDQATGRELTSKGISTCVAWAGNMVLWGDHTAAYESGREVDPESIFDVSMRMLKHITNDFQQEWAPSIDSPMTRALKDRILNREQAKLDAYLNLGALIGTPIIEFNELDNPVENIMNGDFAWTIAVTPTPPLKSATVYVAYTSEGFSAYF